MSAVQRFLVQVEWDLDGTGVDVEELRTWVRDVAADTYRRLPGVNLKCWYSNPQRGTWGAVYVVDDPHALDADRLPRNADGRTGPVGVAPHRVVWNLAETVVEGPSRIPAD